MQAQGRKESCLALTEPDKSWPTSGTDRGYHNAPDSGGPRLGQNLVPVQVEGCNIQVAMGVDQHE